MKKKLKIIFVASISFVSISAINFRSSSKQILSKEKNEKDTMQVKTLFYRDNKLHAFFSIDYPVLCGLANDTLEKLRNNQFKTEAETRKKEWSDEIISESKLPVGDCAGYEYYTYVIHPGLTSNYFCSYKIIKDGQLYCETGHHHGVECKTINLSTGNFLKLKDFFPNVDSIVWMDTLAAKAKKYFNSASVGKTKHDLNLFAPITYFNYLDFVLEEKGISFLIDPNDLDSGDVNDEFPKYKDDWITIPYSELSPIVTKKSFLWEVATKNNVN